MFNKLRFAYHLSQAEKLVKMGANIDDEKVRHHKDKLQKILKRKES